MADGIGRLSGYGNYGVGGYLPQQKNNAPQDEEGVKSQVQQNNYNETQIDPAKVMEFLATNNYFVQESTSAQNVDAEMQDRINGYMEQFEYIYGIIVKEFGEDIAPQVMDLVMDKLLMGDVA